MDRRPLTDGIFEGWSRAERLTLLFGLALTTTAVVATRLATLATWIRFWDNVHWTVAYASAATLAWLSVRRANGVLKRARRWFAIALTALTLGQLTWDIQVAVGWNPFPGPSDALYVLLGPLLGVGVLSLASGESRTRRLALGLDGLGIAFSLLALTLATYLPRQGDFTSFTLAVLAAYPTFLLTVTGLLLVVSVERKERPGVPLLLFGGALLGQGLLWMSWNLQTLENALGDGRLINYLFSFDVLALGTAVASYRPHGGEVRGWLARAYYLTSRLVPLALVLAAAVAVIASTDASSPVRHAVVVCMAGVILVSVVRQSLLLRERERQLATVTRRILAFSPHETASPGAVGALRPLAEVVAPASAAAEVSSPEPPSVSQATSQLPAEKFLIVDDEAAIGVILVRLLKLVGQPAESVTSPEAALARVRENPREFWLVVTDMSMPTMNGLELAGLLRQVAPHLVLVLSSGTDYVVSGTPFDDVLPKPYTVDTLTALVLRHRATLALDK